MHTKILSKYTFMQTRFQFEFTYPRLVIEIDLHPFELLKNIFFNFKIYRLFFIQSLFSCGLVCTLHKARQT